MLKNCPLNTSEEMAAAADTARREEYHRPPRVKSKRFKKG
jgi:hypothetical protein